jgi:hypothetical protein
MKLHIMPGPAFWAAAAVRTKMPVPMMAPTPSNVSCTGPSERCSDFFSAVANMAFSGLMRSRIMKCSLVRRRIRIGALLMGVGDYRLKQIAQVCRSTADRIYNLAEPIVY